MAPAFEKESFYFEDEHNRWHKVTIPLAAQQDGTLDFDHSNHYPRTLVLICQCLPESRVSPSLDHPNMATVLVSVVENKDDVSCVRFLTRVYMVGRSNVSNEDAVALEHADRCIHEDEDVVLAEFMPPLSDAQMVQLEWDMDLWCEAFGQSAGSFQKWCVL